MNSLNLAPSNRPADYVECGLLLVPIPIWSKGPSTTDWNLRENAIAEPWIAAGLTGNIGIAHAYCEPTPTAALDIDDLEKAIVWFSDRGLNLDALLNAPDAVQIISGREGRAKLLFRLRLGTSPILTVQVKDPDTGEMILEFRCAAANGLTVQDLLPPSIHPDTGKPYRWGGQGNWSEIPTIPESLLAIWRAEIDERGAKHKAPRDSRPPSTSIDDTPRKRATVLHMLEHISADCSYDVYRNIVWAILSLGWHDGEGMAKQWSMTAPNRFDEGNFYSIVAGYDECRTPTLGTIHHYAREGGWND